MCLAALVRAIRLRSDRELNRQYQTILLISTLHSSMMMSLRPMMAFMGVRISWDMLARNSLLAMLAFSACWRTRLISLI